MIDHFKIKYDDIADILIPVDRHDIKISHLMGYISDGKVNDKNIAQVKKIFNIACKKSHQSWLTFDKALWLLGSIGKPKSKEDIFRLLDSNI